MIKFSDGSVLKTCNDHRIYNREIIPYSQFGELPEKMYTSLRLGEQPQDVNRNAAFVLSDDLVGYVKRMIFLQIPHKD